MRYYVSKSNYFNFDKIMFFFKLYLYQKNKKAIKNKKKEKRIVLNEALLLIKK